MFQLDLKLGLGSLVSRLRGDLFLFISLRDSYAGKVTKANCFSKS